VQPTPAFQYQLDRVSAAQWSYGSWKAAALDADGTFSLAGAPADGQYALYLRATAPQLLSVSTTVLLHVDATPPVVRISTAPSGVVSTAKVAFAYVANEEGATFQCFFEEGKQPAAGDLLLRRCPGAVGHVEYGGLVDGRTYTFAVRATDRVGNPSEVQATALT